jgi:hypothetical protein
LNASKIDLEALEKLFDEVIGEPELITQTATGTESNELSGEAIAIHKYTFR